MISTEQLSLPISIGALFIAALAVYLQRKALAQSQLPLFVVDKLSLPSEGESWIIRVRNPNRPIQMCVVKCGNQDLAIQGRNDRYYAAVDVGGTLMFNLPAHLGRGDSKISVYDGAKRIRKPTLLRDIPFAQN
jgi:hypothetical protein